ncbi:MAG: LptF/LptG family permease [Dysgonamonadaceae bacterium]|jgi:lipopolysaccharide export system permease protein|nr:LptF/LptG family permease [Dysgonamonadaceae bacterium]
MFRIKKLYSFLIKTFLPLLLVMFSVCLFILLMQFIWKYVGDMVGKGVEIKVLIEMLAYAALYLVPLGLPLSILLASLMTFGNLGEHLELLSIKSSGISLMRIMKPLIILIAFIAVIDFVFQNQIAPKAQGKLWTILWSLRQKSPELDIPEGSFCKEIPNYNVYVREKEKNGLLKDMMIYDFSGGYGNAVVIVADSGRLKTSDDKKHLALTLYTGEQFQNMNFRQSNRRAPEQIPYVRQSFSFRQILIPFDSNFNMADESFMQNRDFTKNTLELVSFIDSAKVVNDSIRKAESPFFINRVYAGSFIQPAYGKTNFLKKDTIYTNDFEKYFKQASLGDQMRILESARSKANMLNNDLNFRLMEQTTRKKEFRGHRIELNRRFSYSLACLLFFFIGAPLGAIIRKGGLGVPTVLSVFIFILYYTVDLFGLKMARQGVWPVWQGMWLSNLLLVGLGAFFTYKAVNDSVIMNPDVWKNVLQRLIGKREMRNYSRKEVIMVSPDYEEDVHAMQTWNNDAKQYLQKDRKFSFWKNGFEDKELDNLVTRMETWIEDLRNSEENLIIGKLMDYPVINQLKWPVLDKPSVRRICFLLFPLGISLYLFYTFKQRQINNDLSISMKVNEEIEKELWIN